MSGSGRPYRGGADQLAASAPEVSWSGRRVRVFLPAARLYGGRHGGAVALLSPEAARELAAAISTALAAGPPSASERAASSPGRDVPEVLRGVSR